MVALVIEPSPIAEMIDMSPMRARTALATAFGSSKADRGRQLTPVDRVEPAVFGTDWHRPRMNHSSLERKGNSYSYRLRLDPSDQRGAANVLIAAIGLPPTYSAPYMQPALGITQMSGMRDVGKLEHGFAA